MWSRGSLFREGGATLSLLTYTAADTPLREVPNPHDRLLSVNEALALGIEVPEYLLTPSVFKALLGSDVTEEFHEIPIQYRLVITEEKK